jgi:hypothetical protein
MDRRSPTLNASPLTVPLWLRLLRQIVQEARPSIRDAVVATLTAAFALLLQIYQGDLSWSLSTQNAVRAQFPIVAFFAVFFVLHVGKAAQCALREIQAESQIHFNPYPSLVLPNDEVILIKKCNASRERIKLIGMVAVFIVISGGACMISWHIAYWSPHVTETAGVPKGDSLSKNTASYDTPLVSTNERLPRSPLTSKPPKERVRRTPVPSYKSSPERSLYEYKSDSSNAETAIEKLHMAPPASFNEALKRLHTPIESRSAENKNY